MPKDKKRAKPKERVHVGKAALGIAAAAALGSIPNAGSGGQSPLQKLEYASQAADDDNWWDPNTGVAANVALATEGLTGNLLSIDGVVVVGGSVVLWEVFKASGLGRRSFLKTRHHAIGL